MTQLDSEEVDFVLQALAGEEYAHAPAAFRSEEDSTARRLARVTVIREVRIHLQHLATTGELPEYFHSDAAAKYAELERAVQSLVAEGGDDDEDGLDLGAPGVQ